MEKYVITIGRQLGSGGHAIANALSERLGIKVYDNNLVDVVASESGFNPELLAKHDERPHKGFFGLFSGGRALNDCSVSPSIGEDDFFHLQSSVLQKLAKEESLIVVGRCADYVLRDMPNLLTVFIAADLEDRITSIAQRNNLSRRDAERFIDQGERQRVAFYNYYTFKTWGDSASYDLCINSSRLGFEGTVETIINVLNQMPWMKK